MEMQQLTRALSSSIKEPKANFPLPRELRDQIYGYLLDGEFTRIPRTCDNEQAQQNVISNSTRTRAYRFHTSILAVNRAIHDEAQELLYKRNMFVVVSYQWPELNSDVGGLIWIPTLSSQHVSKMKHHCLRVHVSACSADLNAVGQSLGSKVRIRSCIILEQDLSAFRAALNLAVTFGLGPSVCVGTNLGITSVRACLGLRTRTTIKVELRETEYRLMDTVLQHRLLAPISSIVGPCQRVFIIGSVCNPQEVEMVKRSMSPSLICQTAVNWSIFESFILLKNVADACLEHDDEFATHMLHMLLDAALSRSQEKWHVYEWAEANSPEMVNSVYTFDLELMINVACGFWKLGKTCAHLAMFDKIIECSQFWADGVLPFGLPAGIKSYLWSLELWSKLYTDYTQERGIKFRPVWTVEQTVAGFERLHLGPHQAHEVQKLEALPDQKALLAKEVFPLEQCSVMVLPFPATSYYKTANHCMQLGHYHVLQDVELLKSLEPSLKAGFSTLQRTHNLEVTDFASL